MRNGYFGRGMLAGFLAVAGAGCTSPTPTWDVDGNYQGTKEKLDRGKIAAGASRFLVGGVLGNTLAGAIEHEGEKQRMSQMDQEIQRLRAENLALKTGQISSGETSSVAYLSDKELLSALQRDPCFYVQYVGNDESAFMTNEGLNPLEELAGNWEGKGKRNEKNAPFYCEERLKVKETIHSDLTCDGQVLVTHIQSNFKSGLINNNKVNRLGYTVWDGDANVYRTISYEQTFTSNVLTDENISKGTLIFEEETGRFVADSSVQSHIYGNASDQGTIEVANGIMTNKSSMHSGRGDIVHESTLTKK